jgi:hypothetical protein
VRPAPVALQEIQGAVLPDEAHRCGGVILDMLRDQGLCRQGQDVYYDASDMGFAQPALQVVIDGLGMQWLEDRVALAHAEHAAHERLCQYAQWGGPVATHWRHAAGLIAGAVGGGLTGALNFGSFAMVVAQVHAAMNRTPAGFDIGPASPFTAQTAGRQVVLNLLGALPGSIAYGICAGLSATVVRPLVDAVAILLSGGQVTPMVPVDPALVYPTPQPLDARGHPVDGAAYTAALEATARQRKALALRQAAMTSQGDFFNLRFGTPLFMACHAARLMYLEALLQQGRAPGAGVGAGLSAAASGTANCLLGLVSGIARMGATVSVQRVDPCGVARQFEVPMFLTRIDMRRIQLGVEPSLRLAVRQEFQAASHAYLRHTGLLRKLLLGLPASGLGIFAATIFINTLVPVGTLLAEMAVPGAAGAAGALAVSGSVTALAFAASYWCVCKALACAGDAVRRNLEDQQRRRVEAAFRTSLECFARRFPEESFRLTGSRAARWTAAQACVLFDEMNGIVLDDLRAAVDQQRNRRLDPGADQRLYTAYAQAADQMRSVLLAAALLEAPPRASPHPEDEGRWAWL